MPGAELDGHSVVPLIEDPAAPSFHQTLHWAWGNGWAVREGPWKLIGSGGKPTFLGNLEDLEPERRNHREENPEVVARLHALHKAWLRDVQPVP